MTKKILTKEDVPKPRTPFNIDNCVNCGVKPCICDTRTIFVNGVGWCVLCKECFEKCKFE